MAKLVKKLSLKQGDTVEDFYFDATAGVKGYNLYNSDGAIVVGKWVDGRPIYRKTYFATSASAKNTSALIVPNSTDQDIASLDVIVKISGCVYRDSGIIMQIPHASQATYDEKISVYYRSGASYGLYETHSADYYNSKQIVVIIDFVKSTDQPGSFIEEKIELTTEHKTGETFNGKDVYEKVWKGTTPASSGTAVIGNLADMDNLIEVAGSYVSVSGSTIPINIFQDSSTYNYVYVTGTGSITMEVRNSSHFKRPLRLKLKYTKKD